MSVAGTAKANTDFVPIHLDLSGEGTFEYTLVTVNDDIYEGNEVFYFDYDVDLVPVGRETSTDFNGRITVTIDDEDVLRQSTVAGLFARPFRLRAPAAVR